MRHKKRKKYDANKIFVEIRTAKNHWIRVELLKSKGGIIIIKLPNGQVIGRKNVRVRPVIQRVNTIKVSGTKNSFTKNFKTKKKRRKISQKKSNKRPPISNKWKDPKKINPKDLKRN